VNYLVQCSACGREYPVLACLWRCPQCGGVLELSELAAFDRSRLEAQQPGMWRYRHTFPFGEDVAPVSFGEGGTPLVASQVDGRAVHFKLDHLNPTGSFKDRGMAVLATALVAAGISEAVEDSSGNAGASFSAYMARAGIRGRVFVPESASPAKRAQIALYGAEVVPISGPRSQAALAARTAAEGGQVYASHNYNPICLAGWMTVAFELWEELGQAPDWVITPAGYGSNVLSMDRGFRMLLAAGLIDRLPRLVAVQARACAPLWLEKAFGPERAAAAEEGATLAEGIRVIRPVRPAQILAAISRSGGDVIAVDEDDIGPGRVALGRLGYFVEPTSAVVWSALQQIMRRSAAGEAVVVILTGNGLKQPLQ
jgi:threonine synthase